MLGIVLHGAIKLEFPIGCNQDCIVLLVAKLCKKTRMLLCSATNRIPVSRVQSAVEVVYPFASLATRGMIWRTAWRQSMCVFFSPNLIQCSEHEEAI